MMEIRPKDYVLKEEVQKGVGFVGGLVVKGVEDITSAVGVVGKTPIAVPEPDLQPQLLPTFFRDKPGYRVTTVGELVGEEIPEGLRIAGRIAEPGVTDIFNTKEKKWERKK